MLTNQRLHHPSQPAHYCLITALVGGASRSPSVLMKTQFLVKERTIFKNSNRLEGSVNHSEEYVDGFRAKKYAGW